MIIKIIRELVSDKCTRGTCRNRDREVGLWRVSGIHSLTGRVRNLCVARWPLHYHNRILGAANRRGPRREDPRSLPLAVVKACSLARTTQPLRSAQKVRGVKPGNRVHIRRRDDYVRYPTGLTRASSFSRISPLFPATAAIL